MSVSMFLRHHRDRAVAYALTIRRSQERKYLMALLNRLKIVEASLTALSAANLTSRVAELETEVTELNHPDTGAASIADLKALSGRVDDVETILGTPDERAADLAAAKAEIASAAAAAAAGANGGDQTTGGADTTGQTADTAQPAAAPAQAPTS